MRVGTGLIDAAPPCPQSSASGSSISEELDQLNGPTEVSVSGMRDYDILDDFRTRQPDDDSNEAEDTLEESFETEDWELADGDFTKQYNRARQRYEALNIAGPSRQISLPAQNTGAGPHSQSRGTGVTANPKVQEKTMQEKSRRATTEQVLDPRTRLVLTGLINRGIIGKLQRCVSTGKEANVYYAPVEGDLHIAAKIYRTSILNFRSRQAYIEGEYRFRGEYSSSRNPRKMVRLWAEKELRNLRRLEQEGIPSPRAIEVKENVLVMEYLGSPDAAAPRLRDAELVGPELIGAYKSLLISMRRMFQVCKLVHADLSEYNVLYHQNEPYIIDVSQSVEQDHPRALEFLRSDIKNVEGFFQRQGKCPTLGVKRTWDFITGSLSLEEKHSSTPILMAALESLLSTPASPSSDGVFLHSFIPRDLSEIADPDRFKEGDIQPFSVQEIPKDTGTDGDNTESLSDGAGIEDSELKKPRGFRHEDSDAKKERKKAIKEENRERRKQKMPKAEKARLIRKTAR